MEPSDLPSVLGIERACFSSPWTGALFLQELRVPFSRTVLVRPAGESQPVVGYLCRWLVADEMHILNLAVHPRHRRRGIGLLLMCEAMREAREAAVVKMTLEVRRGNGPARRLYESLGFTEAGVRRNYYGRGEDAVLMSLDLEHA